MLQTLNLVYSYLWSKSFILHQWCFSSNSKWERNHLQQISLFKIEKMWTGSLVYTSPFGPQALNSKTNHWASHASTKSLMGFRSRPGAGPSGDVSWYLNPAEVTELPTSELGFHPCQGNLTTSYLLLVPMAQENAKSGDSKKGPASSKEKLGPQKVGNLGGRFLPLGLALRTLPSRGTREHSMAPLSHQPHCKWVSFAPIK